MNNEADLYNWANSANNKVSNDEYKTLKQSYLNLIELLVEEKVITKNQGKKLIKELK